MKKLMLSLIAVVVMMSMTALAQDTMKHDDMNMNNDKAAKSTKADKGKMGKAVSVAGYVSDEKCGAKVDAACAKKCIASGQKVVFVDDSDKKVWNVTNPDALKGHEGHHVTVKGHVDKDAGTIHVMSVKMLASKGKKTKAAS